MFGLMRAKKCGMTAEEKELRRLNYCGTCKTIGALYGQKARFLLNHDTVFLAEILAALSGGENYEKAYRSYNCLSLPQSEMPFSLQFAATTNVILTRFKLDDHVADEGKRRYRMAHGAFAREFERAEKLLAEWNFPLGEVTALLDSQAARERSEKSLDAVARPTAETTGIFFREGVRLAGRPELAATAFELGFEFGRLVYLIDAFDDYEKDFRARKFNAFRAAFDFSEEKPTPAAKRKIAAVLRAAESSVIEKIGRLPIGDEQKKLFISRLSQNLDRRLKPALPVLAAKKSCAPKPRRTFAGRWQAAADKARALAYQYRWQMPLVFLFVFVFALAAPAQTREARSARECFDLSFNLMTLGAVFGAVLAFPRGVLMQNLPPSINEKVEKKRRWCDYCDCDCNDGCCDGCCCCCETGQCCGDGCGCDCSCD